MELLKVTASISGAGAAFSALMSWRAASRSAQATSYARRSEFDSRMGLYAIRLTPLPEELSVTVMNLSPDGFVLGPQRGVATTLAGEYYLNPRTAGDHTPPLAPGVLEVADDDLTIGSIWTDRALTFAIYPVMGRVWDVVTLEVDQSEGGVLSVAGIDVNGVTTIFPSNETAVRRLYGPESTSKKDAGQGRSPWQVRSRSGGRTT